MAVTHRAPGLILTEREHVVPLNHASPDERTITVFTREVAAAGGEDKTYLSFAPEGLKEALITGGLAPIGRPVDDVYRATYARMIERNRDYFERYPEDRARVREITETLDAEDIRLPNGDRLTSRRFLQVGSVLGMSDGPETVHHVLELPLRSRAFLHDVEP